jgi:hypothetical protein
MERRLRRETDRRRTGVVRLRLRACRERCRTGYGHGSGPSSLATRQGASGGAFGDSRRALQLCCGSALLRRAEAAALQAPRATRHTRVCHARRQRHARTGAPQSCARRTTHAHTHGALLGSRCTQNLFLLRAPPLSTALPGSQGRRTRARSVAQGQLRKVSRARSLSPHMRHTRKTYRRCRSAPP